MKHVALLALLTTLAAAVAPYPERVWTDELGRATRATLLKVEGQNVVLLLPDGREAPFRIAKLSKIDQAFIEKFQTDLAEKKPEPPENKASLEGNFSRPWPERVTFEGDPEIKTVSENAEAKEFIYESASYRYTCDVRLSQTVVKAFAVMFEATYKFVRDLPLALDGGPRGDEKNQILLFEKESSYIEAGGPPGSGGVFIGGKNIVMVPLTSLGVRPVGSGYMLDRDKSSETLPHELAHQLTPYSYFAPGARGWFSEGIAEYIANTPYRAGSFNVKSNFAPFVKYVTDYGEKGTGGRALGTEIELGSLEKYMLIEYSSFTASNSKINYGCALLITNYFLHLDRAGDGKQLKEFLKALRAGKVGQDAIDVLLDGRTYQQMEKEIQKAYSRKGVDLTF